MTSQDDRRTMEAMLASIREAIHRETALQLAGLHRTGDRVVVDHEPVSRPAAPAAVEGADASPPDYLRPLKEKADDDLIPPSSGCDEANPTTAHAADGAETRDIQGGETLAQPLRLAAGAAMGTMDVDAVGNIEDLFDAGSEQGSPASREPSRQSDRLFEDLLAGRRPVDDIVSDQASAESRADDTWQEPARLAAGPASTRPPAVDASLREEASAPAADMSGNQTMEEEGRSAADNVAPETGDPLNEIDLDDDIIWTAPEAEAPVHGRHETETPARASTKADAAAHHGDHADSDGMDEAALVAPEVAERVAEAFGRLDAEVMLGALGGNAALERIVRQEMRPLLREWLNAHLPALVERVIRKEIRRIVHGGRTPRSL